MKRSMMDAAPATAGERAASERPTIKVHPEAARANGRVVVATEVVACDLSRDLRSDDCSTQCSDQDVVEQPQAACS